MPWVVPCVKYLENWSSVMEKLDLEGVLPLVRSVLERKRGKQEKRENEEKKRTNAENFGSCIVWSFSEAILRFNE